MQATNQVIVSRPFHGIRPINDFDTGRRNFYGGDLRLLNGFIVIKPSQSNVGKTIYLASFAKRVSYSDYPEILRANGKRICRDIVPYFLGFISQVSEAEMPPEFEGYEIVAHEPGDESSVFLDPRDSCPSVLLASRQDGRRFLNITGTMWCWLDGPLFLTEDLAQ